ncbi:hypothetical protein, partial [Pseudomonas nunensis]|uniref:hypothetical protein n=1 Tax=Pseudomonas nunensis TaxID=2961896 RepID=UPI001F37BACE
NLAARQNSVIELTWELIRGGMPAGESAALRLSVNRMIDGDPRLTTPTAPPGNITSTLDLSSFTGNTTAQLKGQAPERRLGRISTGLSGHQPAG